MKIETPGPGSYRSPSDFGHLDLLKSPRMSTSPRDFNNSMMSQRQTAPLDATRVLDQVTVMPKRATQPLKLASLSNSTL